MYRRDCNCKRTDNPHSKVGGFVRLNPNNGVTEAPYVTFDHQLKDEPYPRRGGHIQGGVEIKGTDTLGYMRIQSTLTEPADGVPVFDADKSKLILNFYGGNVGVGTNDPKAKLNVIAGATAEAKNVYKATFSSITSSDALGSYVSGDGTINPNIYRTYAADDAASSYVTGLNSAVVYEGTVNQMSALNGAYINVSNLSETGDVAKITGLDLSVLHNGKKNVASHTGINIRLVNTTFTQPESTITDQTGLYVETVAGATNSNHAIYTNSGKVSLGDVLVLRKQGNAPTSSADTSGENGEIRYDGNYIYIKVGGQWKRSTLSNF